MRLKQFSLRKMLVLVALIAFFFPCASVFRGWLHQNRGQSYVEGILHAELREGQSLANVSSHFDSTRLLTPANDAEYLANLKTICASQNFEVEDDDEFYHLSVASGPGAYLQFRKEKLINLWNSASIDQNKFPGQRASNSTHLVFFVAYVTFSLVVLGFDSWLIYCKNGRQKHGVHRSTA